MLGLQGRDRLRCSYPAPHNYVLWIKDLRKHILVHILGDSTCAQAPVNEDQQFTTETALNKHCLPKPNLSTQWKKTANSGRKLQTYFSGRQRNEILHSLWDNFSKQSNYNSANIFVSNLHIKEHLNIFVKGTKVIQMWAQQTAKLFKEWGSKKLLLAGLY